MSYSRWITSDWYTFWCTQDESTENRDTAIFEICTVASFTAEQLRKHLDDCMEHVKKVDPNGDIEELKIYVERFLVDVNKEFPKQPKRK